MNRDLKAWEIILMVGIAVIVLFVLVKKESGGGVDSNKNTTDEYSDNVVSDETVDYPTADNCTLYDDQGIKIQMTRYKETSKSITIDYEIENNCGVTASVDTAGVAVNGCMIQGEMDSASSVSVGSGTKSNASLTISKDKYSVYGIDETKRIEVQFNFADEGDVVFGIDNSRPEPSLIQTNKDDGTYSVVSGNTIYDNGGIAIDYISDEDGTYRFMVRNNTGGFFRVFGMTDYFAINDYSISLSDSSSWTDFFYETVFNNDSLMIEMNLTGPMNANDISSVETIKFALECSEPGKYYGINNTDTIVYSK